MTTRQQHATARDRTAHHAPALYDAVVTHVRREKLKRSFSHPVYLWLVDLDHLPRLPRPLRPFARFSSADHLGSPGRSIRDNLDNWLATKGIDLHGGTVLMLANARVLGYVFNPITLYWCHTPDGEQRCVVAEVHNTYGERHCYLLDPDRHGNALVAKDFYVSPFLTVAGDYRMSVPRPDERLAITVSLRQGGATPLTAVLRGTRRPAGPAALAGMLLRRPLLPQRISALIRAHGIFLWLRGIPIIPRTPHQPQEGVQ
ncbi:MAG TPA: DUF1365 domain-containing protein [Pseudonocardiaceae bacterium]|jgi:hypothetical protein|nr:DUF1365 domain-containing protein [Pseudonocardiaceae bacterium]